MTPTTVPPSRRTTRTRALPRVAVPPSAGVWCHATFLSRPPFAFRKMLPSDIGTGGIALRIPLREGLIHADLPVKLEIHTPEGPPLELDGVVRDVKGWVRRRVGIEFERNSIFKHHERALTGLVLQHLKAPPAEAPRRS